MTLMNPFLHEFWINKKAKAYRKAGLASLDFNACGNSQAGKYITLGCKEGEQVKEAVL